MGVKQLVHVRHKPLLHVLVDRLSTPRKVELGYARQRHLQHKIRSTWVRRTDVCGDCSLPLQAQATLAASGCVCGCMPPAASAAAQLTCV